MILHEVALKPEVVKSVTYAVESEDGLKWAVLYRDKEVVALFGSAYWADQFIRASNLDFSIREVAE